ncbi:MAG: hypothetical protein CVV05_02745 [Gammaproteobacteria bacterium HGW-Gammaproteobacteria-1]|jgi:hypothetical protein|nr:MAG: hypothetical protein CVV05_02745 [Gammaproteobacteria bacterium HGW-Gammaproteobacteria-1]
MNTRRLIAFALGLLLLAVMDGCNTTTAGGGTGGTGMVAVVSRGTVSSIGSIWVNGVEYDTTGALLTLADGSTQIDTTGTAGGTVLREGMVVTVSGTHNGATGQADSVSYSRTLVGPITALTTQTGAPAVVTSMTVLGQTVVIDAISGFTRLDPVSWTPAPGDWVEVSGFGLVSGQLHASYARQLLSHGELEMDGVVTAVDTGSFNFTINGATIVQPPVGYGLSPALEGSYVAVAGVAGTTVHIVMSAAPEIKNPELGGDTDEEAEVEGVVSAAPVAGEFVLAGQRVVVDANTQYSGGLAADVVGGVTVEAEGTLGMDGRLYAGEITFKDAVEIEAVIGTYDGVAQTFTLLGLGGLVVSVDDALTTIAAPLVLADGVPVKVRGRMITGGAADVLATKIETGDAAAVQLQGKLDSVTADRSSFTVLGVPVAVTGSLVFELDGSAVDAVTFFDRVLPGQLIEVDGIYSGAVVDWSNVVLEQ